MATIIDNREEEVVLEDDEQLQTFEDSEDEQTEEVEQDTEQESDIPEKYRNKDIKDIIAMHQNAEQLLGKQGQEVGELRKVVDDFIQSQTVNQQHAQTVDDTIDDLDFFDNPKEAVAKLLDNHPSIKQSKEMADKLKKEAALAELKGKHPDFMDIIQDSKFSEWVGKSKIRTQLLQQADKHYDFDAADELLTTWKERKDTMNTTVASERKARRNQVRTASAGTSAGSAERPGRKIYRRNDIIDLMRNNPERYEALLPEIRQAYAEKRVK
jgi:hypothetical protein